MLIELLEIGALLAVLILPVCFPYKKRANAIKFPNDDRYIVFDNLIFKYYGYCVVETKGSNCSYRNLDISYIGGGNNTGKDTINGVIYKGRDHYNDDEK